MQRAKTGSIVSGVVAISVSAILWGLDGVVLTPRLNNLKVEYVVFLIHAVPFLIMNFFLYKQYKYLSKFKVNDYFTLILVALFGGALGTIAIVKALFLVNFQQLTVVVLLQKLQPVFAIIMAALVLKEKIKGAYALWAGLAIVAGYFMTFGFSTPDFAAGGNSLQASLLALLAAFAFGSSTVFSKKILHKFNFKTATFYRYAFTTTLMLVYIIYAGNFGQIEKTTTNNWIIVMIIALTTGSGAIFLYYFGLTKVKAIISAIAELFFPISVIVFDYIFNDTRLTLIQWGSVTIMLFAIIMLNISNSRSILKK